MNLENAQFVGDDSSPLANFLYALKTPETRRQYPKRLEVFLDFLNLKGTLEDKVLVFHQKSINNPAWLSQKLIQFIQYQKERVQRNEISETTIPNYLKAIKLFCVMNDITINWQKLSKGLPTSKRAAEDRAPTIDEIKKLLEYPDRRIKPIVLMMMSFGIRVGAFDYLKWKHIVPLKDEVGKIIAAKMVVYPGDREEYFTFITSEAYNALKEWIDFWLSFGEKINGESWVMRDIWQTTNVDYGAKWGLATIPKRLHSSAIKRMINRALWEQGIRHPLQNGVRRHEFKTVHGFRKFFKTHCEQVMKSINVEILMGYTIGVSDSYYKPAEREILEDYLKAITVLNVNNSNNKHLEEEIQKVREKYETNESTIKKLQEKDDAYIALSDQVMMLMEKVQKLESNKEDITKK